MIFVDIVGENLDIPYLLSDLYTKAPFQVFFALDILFEKYLNIRKLLYRKILQRCAGGMIEAFLVILRIGGNREREREREIARGGESGGAK